MDYRELLAAHDAGGAGMTLAVTRVPLEQAYRFGMVTLDAFGRVAGLIEKPERAPGPLASMGIYVFEAALLRQHLGPDRVNLVTDVVVPLLAAGAAATLHEFKGYWEDVGTIGPYYRANLDLVADHPRLVLDDRRWPILTRDEARPPVRISEGAQIEQSLISNGCRVAGTVRRSVLSPGVEVEAGAVVEDTVVFQDAVIERGAEVRDAIVDKVARIGAGARVGGPSADGAGPDWLEGLVLVGKDARVPSGAHIEPGVVVGVGAEAGDFGEGVLHSGARLPDRTWYGERT
jgi:glucose-1-phosphate adenylyltransferase